MREDKTLPAADAGPVDCHVRPFAQLVERIGSPPDTHCWDEDSAADCWSYSPQMVAELLDAERDRAVRILEAYRVPVGNSAAGEMAAEWTMDALREIRDAIRGA